MSTGIVGNGTSTFQMGGWTVVDKTSSDATWSIPSGVSSLNIVLISGGGGGGAGGADENALEAQGGGGGAGGNILIVRDINVAYMLKYSKTVPIVVGAGGAGGAAKTNANDMVGNDGSVGGTTSFANFSVTGGAPGIGGGVSYTTPTSSGLGGSNTNSYTPAFSYDTTCLLTSPSDLTQTIDIFNLYSKGAYTSSSPNITLITGGSGGSAGWIDYTTILAATLFPTNPTGPKFSTTNNLVGNTWSSSVFTAGSSGSGASSNGDAPGGSGGSSGFCGGGGYGGSTWYTSYNQNANSILVTTGGSGVYSGGGGGGAKNGENTSSGNANVGFSGGAAAANTGSGGGGGGAFYGATFTNNTTFTSAGGNGGSGRVIIYYKA